MSDLKRVFDKISTRLNNVLCEMKPNYDDSIVGFNEAWDIMRAVFNGELAKEMPDEWQFIESAPKDGTHILAYRMPIGIRVTNMTNPPTVVHWFDDANDPGFYTSVNAVAPEYPFNPTHWMPLPAAPSLPSRDRA